MKRIIISLALLVVAPTFALAECRNTGSGAVRTGASFFLQDDAVTYDRTTDKGSSCTMSYTAGGQMRFTQATIVRLPTSGKAQQTGNFAFRYTPNAGFRGRDSMAVRLCGENRGRSGCSTINYDITVN